MANRVVAALFAGAIVAGIAIWVVARAMGGSVASPVAASPTAAVASAGLPASPPASGSAVAAAPTSSIAVPTVGAASVAPSASPDQPGSPGPSASAGAAATASGSLSALVADPSLLAVLPTTVQSSAVTRDTDREAGAVTDPGLQANARTLAAATVGDDGSNVATILLVELRPQVAVAAWFPEYRREFDAAACEPLGGPGHESAAQIDGRKVDTTTCLGGGTIYHLVVRNGTTILSVLELGPAQFGRQLLEHLAPGA